MLRAERQIHGFNYQKFIIRREGLLQTPETSSYTAKWDAIFSNKSANIPVQIKLQLIDGEICLADYNRNRLMSENFILHLGFYARGRKDKIIDEKTLYIQASKWRELCSYSFHDSMMAEFKLQTNLKSDDDKWAKFIRDHINKWNASSNRIIHLKPKRDHKHQLRLQLAIPRRSRRMLYDLFLPTTFNDMRSLDLTNSAPSFTNLSISATNINSNMPEKYAQKSVLDKFYTKDDVADTLLDIFFKAISARKSKHIQTVLEPSAGGGSFSRQCGNYLDLTKTSILAIDIDPSHSSIRKLNFLETDLSAELSHYSVAIGNPPFGKQCSVAIKFFNKCAKYTNIHYIGFIVPLSFKKESIQDRLDQNFHLQYQIELKSNSFMLQTEAEPIEYSVPCTFQIWKRMKSLRLKSIKYKPNNHYHFVNQAENADIAFRRVGVYAGKCSIIHEDEKYSPQSHYFIKLKSNTENVCAQINEIKWPSNDTVGPRSISKNSLIKEMNKITNLIHSNDLVE